MPYVFFAEDLISRVCFTRVSQTGQSVISISSSRPMRNMEGMTLITLLRMWKEKLQMRSCSTVLCSGSGVMSYKT